MIEDTIIQEVNERIDSHDNLIESGDLDLEEDLDIINTDSDSVIMDGKTLIQ